MHPSALRKTPVYPSRRAALLGAGTALLYLQANAFASAPADTLEADIAGVEGVRAVKRLQYAFAQYAEAQQWDQIAGLFSQSGKATFSDETATGHRDILALIRKTMGGESPVPSPKRLNVRLPLAPVVNIASSGLTAKGRWHEISMLGVYGEAADWAGGIYENDYIFESGRWKIASLHYFPLIAGPYNTGWRNVSERVGIVPYHYDPDEAGMPVPLGPAPDKVEKEKIATLNARLDILLDESLVQNLQSAYGFYATQKMWDDIADLFAADGTMEIAGQGIYVGRDSIRRGLNRFGPQNLAYGELNDRIQLAPVVTIEPDGQTARVRGIELAMTGEYQGKAFWTVSIYDNHFIKNRSVWKVARMLITPRMMANYDTGWATNLPALPGPSVEFPPDQPTENRFAYPAAFGPAIDFVNPARTPKASHTSRAEESVDLKRKLAVARAYDGAENVSCAYGYYIDEFLWRDTADLFAANGWKELAYVGTYIGRDRIAQSMILRYGDHGRGPGLTLHQKIQPYVTVSDDGQRANIRTFLLQINSSYDHDGSYIRGIYEDEVVLENGLYKIFGLDLSYAWQASYIGGWAKVKPVPAQNPRPPTAVTDKLPPDAPLRGIAFPPFPNVTPVGFHFNNPVSGRPPAVLLPWTDGRHHN